MKISRRSLTLGLAGCLFPVQLAAQSAAQVPAVNSAELQPLEQALEEVRSEFGLPGLAAGIVSRQGIGAMAAVGVRKTGSPIAVSTSDLWHLGSCTKAMTATLLGLLVQEGLLTWETTLAELFADEAEAMGDDFRKITLEHLLTHRSGLPANGPWWQLGREQTPTEQRKELLRRLSTQPLEHPPGTHFEYSNVGYALAGLMAEQVLKQAWEDALWERVLEPLEIDRNQIGFGIAGSLGEMDQPWGHRERVPGLGPLEAVQLDNASSLGPAGTVHASLEAWAKFIALHLDRQHPLLRPELWDKLHTPPLGSDYGMGWSVLERSWAKGGSGIGQVLTHTGSNTVNYCVCWLAPERGFAVIAATNSGQANAFEALDKVASLLLKRIPAQPAPQ